MSLKSSLDSLLDARGRDLAKLLLRPSYIRPYLTGVNSVEFVSRVTQTNSELIQRYQIEFFRNHHLRTEICTALVERRGTTLGPGALSGATYYALIRSLNPSLVVETGVFDGINTAIMLEALEVNGHGRLISIDLPARRKISDSSGGMMDGQLPLGADPGWLIPDRLRHRHVMLLGDSRTLLPDVIKRCGVLDLFIHDSLHTAAHMTLEYDLAWPAIRSGGILMSDDIFAKAAGRAFFRFCNKHKRQFTTHGNLGAIVK